ncbi:hypothetical protein E1301_Tti018229 [Triplophysa tibetana]|uniref:Uncharacterized protein n=1 Tax=Triplophysa tibetana TaxID=1572043 RepID=A0A5A9NTQ9_9TELE|nr:hypothetical protein E1301_Tti018229 [Triplophysa tibetana]
MSTEFCVCLSRVSSPGESEDEEMNTTARNAVNAASANHNDMTKVQHLKVDLPPCYHVDGKDLDRFSLWKARLELAVKAFTDAQTQDLATILPTSLKEALAIACKWERAQKVLRLASLPPLNQKTILSPSPTLPSESSSAIVSTKTTSHGDVSSELVTAEKQLLYSLVTIDGVIGGSVLLPCASNKHEHNLQDIDVLWRYNASMNVFTKVKVYSQITVDGVVGRSVFLPCASHINEYKLQDVNVHWRYNASMHVYDKLKARCLEAMRSLPTLAPNIYREFKDGKFTVRQTKGRFSGVWTDMALEKTYNRDAKTKLFTGIIQQPAAMEKYLKVVSEQTKAMAHLEAYDTEHHEDKGSQGAKGGVRKLTDVINIQMVNLFTSEEQDLIKISTGHKATCDDLICAQEKGLEALAAARRTDSDKIAQIKHSTFAAKPKKSMSMAFKAKKVYEEESAVVRSNFHELQGKYLRQLLGNLPNKFDCIHFVGDRYDFSPAESLKGFIHNPLNKDNLLNYTGETWAAQNKSLPTEGCTLILGGIFCDPCRTVLLSADCQVELPELSCEKHDEADTRMFAHIGYSVQPLHHKRAVVVATDRDVIMMCMYYITHMDELQELWVNTIDIFLPVLDSAPNQRKQKRQEEEINQKKRT